MKNNISDSTIFTKEKSEYLSKIRIIKKNLIHIHGFPKSIAKTEKLKTTEYLGQYGNIIKAMIAYKINPDTNKKAYSAYVTYSNEREAAFAILCVDSLLIEGKIIRAFFGTTKYCSYFLNNSVCPILDKCLFLHKLVTDKDIIIDDNTVFSYNEHINLAKKIIQFSNPITKDLVLKMPKQKKNVFPPLDFIFLSEEEKKKFFEPGNISYISSNNNLQNNLFLNNFIEQNEYEINLKNITDITNNYNINKNFTEINSVKDLNVTIINNSEISKEINPFNNKNIVINKSNNLYPLELYSLFNNSISHILYIKPYFSNNLRIPLRKMELNYFIKDLAKNGRDINELLEGCLDCLSDILK